MSRTKLLSESQPVLLYFRVIDCL